MLQSVLATRRMVSRASTISADSPTISEANWRRHILRSLLIVTNLIATSGPNEVPSDRSEAHIGSRGRDQALARSTVSRGLTQRCTPPGFAITLPPNHVGPHH